MAKTRRAAQESPTPRGSKSSRSGASAATEEADPGEAPKAAAQSTTAQPTDPSPKRSSKAYDESTIKTLSSLEHIRLRSGMYIGRLGDGSNYDDGIYVLLKEVIDNSVDEFIMGSGNRIDIDIDGTMVRVRDYGRGIPLGKVVEAVSVINTGAKYNDDVFQFSVGLNGVGTKAVNALSESFRVVSYRDGASVEALFERGVKTREKKGSKGKNRNGLLVEFTPDEEIFGKVEFNDEFIEQRLWNYAYLNTGLELRLGDRSFSSAEGLKDLLTSEVGDEALYPILHYRGEHLEFAITHTGNYGENHFSFVNGQYTSAGGTHLSAFREGILKAANDFYKSSYAGSDVREGIAGAVSVRLKSPIFESQTKNKLGNTEIRGWILNEVRDALEDLLHRTPEVAKALQDKIRVNERVRKELAAVRKEARENAKKIALKIPNLRDCKYHLGDRTYGEESTIFITEGQSATGSMIAARNVNTQAIFSLRGKPLNVFGKKRSDLYKNEELYNMMMALGIENDISELRYARIVAATDADHDGFHIRNLLLTFFLNYFEELVVSGNVYLLETPLFRVRNKAETRYCYNAAERDTATREVRNPEVTRFKGLGEISPNEFGQFIGPDIRLVRVNVRALKSLHETLEFYMGKNTPDRREYIMSNLV